MKRISVFLIATLLLASCASNDSGRVFSFSDNVHDENVISLSQSYEKSFYYKTLDLEPSDVKNKIIVELKNKLAEFSNQKNIPLRKKEDEYDRFLNTLQKLSDKSGIPMYSSLNWNVSPSGLLISYETIQDYNGRKAIAYQRFMINLDFDFDASNKMLIMTVRTPKKYLERNGNLGSQSMIIPPFESSQILEEIKSVYDNVEIKNISYYKDKKVKGDFVVNYKDDSVYANFIRLGVNDTTERKIEKTARIYLSRGDMKYVTNINVYPYRDTKSKVTYESFLKSVQWIYNDGTTRFDDFPKKDEIEKMIWDIANN